MGRLKAHDHTRIRINVLIHAWNKAVAQTARCFIEDSFTSGKQFSMSTYSFGFVEITELICLGGITWVRKERTTLLTLVNGHRRIQSISVLRLHITLTFAAIILEAAGRVLRSEELFLLSLLMLVRQNLCQKNIFAAFTISAARARFYISR